MIKGFQNLVKEINARGYRNISGLTAEISKTDYINQLEVLPPLRMAKGWFVNQEPISSDLNGQVLYYCFWQKDKKYYCTISTLKNFIDFYAKTDGEL